MIVTCPACSSRYRIREEKIQGRGARITCPSCGHKFIVEKETGSAASGSQGVPLPMGRGAPVQRPVFDEDDEADVPTTVMPHGSQLAQTMRAAAEKAKSARAAAGGSAPAPSAAISPADHRAVPAPAAQPARSGVVAVALVLVAVLLLGMAVLSLLGAF